ncbi:MAG: VCBS repeat-containing protein [Nannocystaceae bacterium]
MRALYAGVTTLPLALLVAACSGDDSGRADSATTSAATSLTSGDASSGSTGDATSDSTTTTTAGTESASGTETGGTETMTSGPVTATATETSGGTTEGDPCGGCPGGFKCKYDVCIPDLGECETYDDCPGDSYCDPDGECIPYGVPPDVVNDPNCVKDDIPEGVTPVAQCEWNGVDDPNDATKGSTLIYTTPIIADLNLDKDPDKLQPSVIVTTWESKGSLGRIGTLRVFDGRTCTEQLRAGGADEANDDNRPAYAVAWAVGDLDADVPDGGHPELVSYRRVTSNNSSGPVNLYAMRVVFDGDEPGLERMWYGRDCANNDTVLSFGTQNMLNGPSLHDLNDDQYPEIIVGEMVFDGDGCLLTDWDAAQTNQMVVIADVDLDGTMDLVSQRRFASWDANTTEWVDKPGFIADDASYGYVQAGVADFGLYTAINGKEIGDLPEVALLTVPGNNFGSIRIQKLYGGQPVWGPIPVYYEGNPPANRGGPITISDFDGDGHPEVASAGATHYAVYDPDCVEALMGQSPPERPGGKCERAPEQEAKNLPDGVLWVQPSQDLSSNITGSSIFDFNGDGAAEAVYRDECFVRVYDGKSGEVIFSAPASSGTGMEYPVIADVDGDFSTEIVVPRTPFNSCPATDPLFPDSGTFKTGTGFIIYRDPLDRWANSRPVWNQHLYSVTHITDSVEVPPAGSVSANWLVDDLNNLRQNSQGDVGKLQIADLTVELTDLGELCNFEGGTKELQAEVCNRGTNSVVDGVVVHFLETMDPDQGVDQAVVVCATQTTKLLKPDDCEVVSCTAELGGSGNIFVDVDPEDLIADCHPGNNLGADAFGLCPG